MRDAEKLSWLRERIAQAATMHEEKAEKSYRSGKDIPIYRHCASVLREVLSDYDDEFNLLAIKGYPTEPGWYYYAPADNEKVEVAVKDGHVSACIGGTWYRMEVLHNDGCWERCEAPKEERP